MDPLQALYELAPKQTITPWAELKFTEFCAKLGVTLEPGQLALARVAYDGTDPCELPPEQRELARRIFGPVDRIPREARRVVVVVAGARAGKTYFIAALRSLHLALSVPLTTLAPGEEAYAVIIAPDPRQRAQCYGYVLGAAQSHPELKALIIGEPGRESFRIKRPDGRVVGIESMPAKRGGSAGRGRSLVCAALEEAAFFQDENYVVNDVEVFRAVTPRVLPGGQTLISSTPWAEAGLLYDEFVANHPDPRCAAPHLTQPGHPHRAIAAHAPTLLLRDVELTRDIVTAEQKRDPANAAREYGAQFLPLGASMFFDAVAIAQSVDHSITIGQPRSSDEQGIAAVGCDLGFVHDASVGAAVERTPSAYTLLSYEERMPGVERLKPSEVFRGLAQLAHTYGTQEVVGDSHYAEAAKEALWDSGGVVYIDLPGGGQGKAEVYGVARHLLAEGMLRLPNDPRLLQQFREVKKRPLPGGGLAIEQPRKSKGGHGDIVSAVVAAIWRLSRLQLPAATEKLPENPRELAALMWERRIEERMRQDELREQAERQGILLMPEDDY